MPFLIRLIGVITLLAANLAAASQASTSILHTQLHNPSVDPTSKLKRPDKTPEDPLVFGYYHQWSIYSPNIRLHQLTVEPLDVLIYASANINEQGRIEPGDYFADIEHPTAQAEIAQQDYLGNFAELSQLKKQHPHLKTLISIGGWNNAEHFRHIPSSDEGYTAFAESVVAFTHRYGFDGIELDWTTLTNRQAQPLQAAINHLSALARAVKTLSQDRLIIAISLPITSLYGHWDGHQLAHNSDVIILQSEQLYGEWSPHTGLLSPIKDNHSEYNPNSLNHILQTALANHIPATQMLISIAPYAIAWEGVTSKHYGLQQSYQTPSWGSWDSQQKQASGLYNRAKLKQLIDSGNYQRYWQEDAQSPWLFSSHLQQGHFISYENADSVAAKLSFINDWQLAGLAIRQLHSDLNGVNGLTYSIYRQTQPRAAGFFWLKHYWHIHSASIWSWLIGLSIGGLLLGLGYWQNALRQRDKQQLRQQFTNLKNQLQHLQWHIDSQFVLLGNRTQDTPLGQSLLSLAGISFHLLTRTRLGQELGKLAQQPVNLLSHLQQWQRRVNPDKIHIHLHTPETQHFFLSNNILLAAMLDRLSESCMHAHQDSPVTLNVDLQTRRHNHPCLIVSGDSLAKPSYGTLKTLLVLADQSNAAIDWQESVIRINFGKLYSEREAPKTLLPIKQTAKYPKSVACIEHDSNEAGNCSTEHSEIKTHNIDEPTHNSDTPEQRHPSLKPEQLQTIRATLNHSQHLTDQLHQIEQFFKDTWQQTIHLVNHHDQLTPADSIASDQSHQTKEQYHWEDTMITVSGDPLTSEQQTTLALLIGHIQGLRANLSQLLTEPSLLNELNTLAQHRDKILYIKADSGYSSVFIKDRPEPIYLTLRLKAISHYFHQDHLRQIHRSYLVNPNWVSRAKAKGRIGYELVIENQTLPISRGFLSAIQVDCPQWFKR